MTTVSSYSPQKENEPISNSPQTKATGPTLKPSFAITHSPLKTTTTHFKNKSLLSPKPSTPNRKIKTTLLTPKGSSPVPARSPLSPKSPQTGSKRSPARSPARRTLSPLVLSPLAWQTHNARGSPNAPATPAHSFVFDHPLRHLPTPQAQYDEFGFEILSPEEATTPGKKSAQSPTKRPQTPTQLRNQKTSDLWKQVLAEWDSWQDSRLSNLIVLRGINPEVRQQVWSKLIKADDFRKVYEDDGLTYAYLKSKGPNEHTGQIKLDIPRTFSTHRFFQSADGRKKLFEVLKAYSHFNGTVGYCQGMSYVCGVLLMYMPEEVRREHEDISIYFHKLVDPPNNHEDAFWVFASMMKKLEGYYQPNMKGVLNDNKVFGHILKHVLPELSNHFANFKIDTLLFCSRWFLSLFTDFPNWETVTRIWDIFFLQGRKGLLRVSLAILKLCKQDLLQLKGIDGLIPYIFRVPQCHIDPVVLFPTALAIDVDLILEEIKQTARDRKEKEQSASDVLSFFNQVRNFVTPRASRKRPRGESPSPDRPTPRSEISNKKQKTSKPEFPDLIFEEFNSAIAPLAKTQTFAEFATPRRETRAMGKPKQELTPINKKLSFEEEYSSNCSDNDEDDGDNIGVLRSMDSEDEESVDSDGPRGLDACRARLSFSR